MSSSPTLPPSGSPVLRIAGVNHHFGEGDTRTQVLFDNNLEVMPGEMVIMSGPVRLRQNDAAHAHRRAAHFTRRRDRGLGLRRGELSQTSRHAGTGTRERPPPDRLHFPAAQPLRLAHGDAERADGAAAEAARHRPGRRCARLPAVPSARRSRPARQAAEDALRLQTGGAVRRPATARRHRASARQSAQTRARRRADRRARRQQRSCCGHATSELSPANGPKAS